MSRRIRTEAADRLIEAVGPAAEEVETAAIELALEAVTSARQFDPSEDGSMERAPYGAYLDRDEVIDAIRRLIQ